MIAHVTAAALASENKSLAHPASVDTLPTSANQEDFVSMATFAARRLARMNANTGHILAIELLAAAEGIEFLRPLRSSPRLEQAHAALRARVPRFERDRCSRRGSKTPPDWCQAARSRPSSRTNSPCRPRNHFTRVTLKTFALPLIVIL